MKVLIVSDLHGDEEKAGKIHDIWKNGRYDRVLLLGDLLYHGPRNDLPPHYNPKGVIPLLSEMKDYITAVRGNCDAEVDQMVLPFSILDEKKEIEIDGLKILLHHGHHEQNISGYDIVMSGHTHIPQVEETEEGIILFNPGSTTIPKNGSKPSYGELENRELRIISLLDGHIINKRKR